MSADATPLTAHQIILNSILNLMLMANETGDANPQECLAILAEAPKAYVLRAQEEWDEDALIHTPIPPRTGQFNDEDLAMPA